MKESIKNFWNITVPVMFVMFVLLEIVLASFFWVSDPYAFIKTPANHLPYIESQFKPNLKLEFEVESFLSNMDEKVQFTTNNIGFRGDSLRVVKGGDEFRIFLFGGSTMENMFIDDAKSTERILQQMLSENSHKDIKVINAAKSGDASPDHLAMLVHRVIHLEPDLIILYAGFNDLTRLIAGYDYLHLPEAEQDVSSSWSLGLKLFLSNFQVYRRIHNVMQSAQDNANVLQDIHLKTNYKEKIEFVQKHEVEQHMDIDLSVEKYHNNLNAFVGASLSNGVPVIVLTQASSWGAPDEFNSIKEFHWMNFIDGKRFDDDQLAIALEKINAVNMQVAAENDLQFLDIEGLMPKSTAYFYDDCHFNINGVKVFSDYLYNFVLENNMID